MLVIGFFEFLTREATFQALTRAFCGCLMVFSGVLIGLVAHFVMRLLFAALGRFLN